MFRNKLLPFLLCLMLTGCTSGSQASEEQQKDMLLLDAVQEAGNDDTPGDTLKTTTVVRGDVALMYSLKAQRVYPFGTDITYENAYATLTFGECLVEEGEFVKAGQELLILHQSINEIDAEEAQRAYARENSAYEVMCADYESQLLELSGDQNAYDRLEFEYENYKTDTQKAISALSEQLAAYEQIQNNPDITLTAPFEGYVADVINRIEGEEVSADDTLMSLQDVSVWYYTLSDMRSVPIGKDVQLYSVTSQGDALEISGSVVCADMALDMSMEKEYAIVHAEQVTVGGEDVTADFDPTTLPEEVNVELCQMELENVLLVPAEYVHTETGGNQKYVYLLENGAQVKTYVICLKESVNGSSWILSGVEEGDVLALN